MNYSISYETALVQREYENIHINKYHDYDYDYDYVYVLIIIIILFIYYNIIKREAKLNLQIDNLQQSLNHTLKLFDILTNNTTHNYVIICNYAINQCKTELIILSHYGAKYADIYEYLPKNYIYKNYVGHGNTKEPIATDLGNLYVSLPLLITETDFYNSTIPCTIFTDVIDCVDIICCMNIKKVSFINVTILNFNLITNHNYTEINLININIDADILNTLKTLHHVTKICIISDNVDWSFTHKLPLLNEITITKTTPIAHIKKGIKINTI